MTKQMLLDYRWLQLEIRQLENLLAELDAKAHKMTATISSDPRGGRNVADRMAETVSKIIDTQVAINDKVIEAMEQIHLIEETIRQLPARERLVMRKRYIDCLEWEQICVDTNYSWRGVHAIHAAALRVIQ